jgi:hypothetical protein
MLSRTASSLYWLGRYVERAEFTARLIEATLRLDALSARPRARPRGRARCSSPVPIEASPPPASRSPRNVARLPHARSPSIPARSAPASMAREQRQIGAHRADPRCLGPINRAWLIFRGLVTTGGAKIRCGLIERSAPRRAASKARSTACCATRRWFIGSAPRSSAPTTPRG